MPQFGKRSPESLQLELPLFQAPSFEEVSAGLGCAQLQVELQPRLRRSWRVVYVPATGRRTLRVPEAFRDAPHDVKSALIRWAVLPHGGRSRNRKEQLRKERAVLEGIVWGYLGQVSNIDRRRIPLDRQALAEKTKGTVYDLSEVFASVNRTFFDGQLDASIRWGTYGGTTSFHRKAVDRAGSRFNLITIAGLYDHPKVPRFAIEAVIYHEALHIAVPPYRHNGRMVIHGPEFRRAERAFPLFDQWRRWEREHAARLVRSLKRRKRR